MPKRPPTPCRAPRCHEYATKRGYCDSHQSVDWQKKRRNPGDYGSDWRKIRKAVLERDGWLCVPCYKQGKLTPAKEVDHIINIASGGTDDFDNLQTICRDCHKRKTSEEARMGREAAKLT